MGLCCCKRNANVKNSDCIKCRSKMKSSINGNNFFFHLQTAQSFGGIGFGIKREIFFLNLEDGYFGCQVNESTDVLQLFELSKLCDGSPNCFLGSDELTKELKCTCKYYFNLLKYE